jgi:hypothetical protein
MATEHQLPAVDSSDKPQRRRKTVLQGVKSGDRRELLLALAV